MRAIELQRGTLFCYVYSRVEQRLAHFASVLNRNTSFPPSAPTHDGCTQRRAYGCREAAFVGLPHLHIPARAFAPTNWVGNDRVAWDGVERGGECERLAR